MNIEIVIKSSTLGSKNELTLHQFSDKSLLLTISSKDSSENIFINPEELKRAVSIF